MPIDPKTVIWDKPAQPVGIVWDEPETTDPKIALTAAGNTAKAMGATGAAGLGEFGIQAATAAAKMHPLAIVQTLKEKLGLTKSSPEQILDALKNNSLKSLQEWEKQHSDLTGMPQALVKGVATGAALGPAGAVNRGAGAVAGAAGVGASESVNKLLPAKEFPVLGPAASTLAGFATGGLTGFALGPKQSVAKRDIRLETDHFPASDWAKAADNIRDFQGVNSKTATLADAFPGDNSLVRLANKAANERGGETLRVKLAGRKDELQGLGDEYVNRIGPKVDPAATANELADAANGFLTTSKGQVNEALRNRLAGNRLTPQQARELYDTLLKAGAAQENPSIAAGYREVAKSLLKTNGEVQRSVQELSLLIKQHKKTAGNPLQLQGQTPAIAAGWGKQAISDAEEGLGELSPTFEQAMQDYIAGRRRLSTEAEGPIGRLTDSNPNIAKATPVSRLNAVVEGNSPTTVAGTARILQNPAMTGSAEMPGPTVDPRAIASALAQQRLAGRPTNPGNAVRGNQGSLHEQQINTLLDIGGADVSHVNQPLRVADQLQKLSPGSNIHEMPQMRSGQLLLRPFRTLDMLMTARTEKQIQEEISKLLINPTQETLNELRTIAMFDPAIRKQLSAVSGLVGGLNGQQENR